MTGGGRRRRRGPAFDRGPRPLTESLDDAVAGLAAPHRTPAGRRTPRGRLRGDHEDQDDQDDRGGRADRGQPGGPGRPGEEGADGGATPPGRVPPPVSSAGTWATVFGRWDEVVGPALARHVQPQRMDGGTLVLAVDQPPWATQVRALGPSILSRVEELAGERFDGVQVVVRPSVFR